MLGKEKVPVTMMSSKSKKAKPTTLETAYSTNLFAYSNTAKPLFLLNTNTSVTGKDNQSNDVEDAKHGVKS